MKNPLIIGILAYFLLSICRGVSVAPTWSTTSLIQAGQKDIVISSAFQNGNPQGDYIINYSPAFTQSPFTALGVISFQSQSQPCTAIIFMVNINDFTNTNMLKINMAYFSAMSLKTFRVSYLAVDASLTYLKIDYFSNSVLGITTSGSGVRTYTNTKTLAFSVDSSHTISVIPLLVGINATSTTGVYNVNWVTSFLSANQIQYNLTVSGNTLVTQLVSYVLIYDKTDGQLTQDIFLDQIYYTGSNNIQTSVAFPLYSNTANLHVGINSFSTTKTMFNFAKATKVLSGTSYTSLNFSAWNFRKRSCANSTPYFQVNSNLCYDICPAGYVNTISSTNYCTACSYYIPFCSTCSNSTYCLSCTNGYSPNTLKTACICSPGSFIEPATSNCLFCDQNCLTCTTSATVCQTCNTLYRSLSGTTCACLIGTLVNGSCVDECFNPQPYFYAATNQCYSSCPNGTLAAGNSSYQYCNACSIYISNCLTCASSTVCTSCQTGYAASNGVCICAGGYFLNSSGLCAACSFTCLECTSATKCTSCDTTFRFKLGNSCLCIEGTNPDGSCTCTTGCSTCPTSPTICTSCLPTFVLISTSCECPSRYYLDSVEEICKSCDASCISCVGPLATQCSSCSNATCTLTNGTCQCLDISIQQVAAIKALYSNSITIQYIVEPMMPFIYTEIDLSDYFTLSIPNCTVNLTSAKYDSLTNLVSVEMTYQQTVSSKDLYVTFALPSYLGVRKVNQVWNIKTSNSLAAIYSAPETYENVSRYRKAFMAIYFIILFFTNFTLYFRKMISLQLVSLLQISFISYSLLSTAPPSLAPILEWRFIFGANQQRFTPQTMIPLDNSLQPLGYGRLFYYSCNSMVLVIISVYAFALLFYIISKVNTKSASRKFREMGIYFVTEVAFGLVIFCMMNIVISTGSEATSHNLLSFNDSTNKIYQITAISILIFNIGMQCWRVDKNHEEGVFYKSSVKSAKYHPIIFIFRNLLLSICIVLNVVMSSAIYGVLAVEGMYILIVFFMRPYKKIIDFIRFIAVESALFGILFMRFMLARYTVSDDSWAIINNYGTPIEIVVLYFAFFMSIVSLLVQCKAHKENVVYPQEILEQFNLNEKVNKKYEQEQKYNKPIVYKKDLIPVIPAQQIDQLDGAETRFKYLNNGADRSSQNDLKQLQQDAFDRQFYEKAKRKLMKKRKQYI